MKKASATGAVTQLRQPLSQPPPLRPDYGVQLTWPFLRTLRGYELDLNLFRLEAVRAKKVAVRGFEVGACLREPFLFGLGHGQTGELWVGW